MMQSDYQRISVLCGVGGNRNGIGSYFRDLDAAGRPAVIASYDDYGVVRELAALRHAGGVPHVLAFRAQQANRLENPDYTLPPDTAAAQYWAQYHAVLPPELAQDKAYVWLIIANEGQSSGNDDGRYAMTTPQEWGDWWGAFSIAIAELAMLRDGYRLLIGGWSAGTPELGFWESPQQHAFLRLCDAYPNALGIAVHEGVDPRSTAAPYDHLINDIPYITRRYQFIFDECDQLGIRRPRIFISECAWKYDDVPDLAWREADIRQAAHYYAQDPEVLGVTLWWCGPGHNNIAHKLAQSIPFVRALALTDEFAGQPIWPDDAVHYQLPPAPTLAEHMVRAVQAQPHFYFGASLHKAILADGRLPLTIEARTLHDGVEYAYQGARDEADNRWTYYAPVSDYNAVSVVAHAIAGGGR